MRLRKIGILTLALAFALPSVALAQDGSEEDADEFYHDPDDDDAPQPDDEDGDDDDTDGDEEDDDGPAIDDDENTPFPISGGMVYENVVSAGAPANDLSRESTFYYAMSYAFSLGYRATDWFRIGLGLGMQQELTPSGSTTRERETLLGDMSIGFTFPNVLSSVTEHINLTPSLSFGLPTSKMSQAATLILSTGLGLSVSYTAPVLEGLRLSYSIGVGKYFHEHSTRVQEAPTITCTPGASGNCDSELNTGARNASWRLSNTVSIAFMPIENLSLSVGVSFLNYWLYDLADWSLDEDGVYTDPDNTDVQISDENQDMRGALRYSVAISYQALPWLGLALGTSTANGQRDPSGDFYPPFFNRKTNIYFDVSLSVDRFISWVQERNNGDD